MISQSVTIQIKATELYLVLFIMLYKVVQCNHSEEKYANDPLIVVLLSRYDFRSLDRPDLKSTVAVLAFNLSRAS